MKPEDLTAWALNELSPEDRAQVEAHLQDSHELQSKARDTKAFCALLTEQLGSADETLTSAQRQALLASVPGNVLAFDASSGAGTSNVAGVCDPGDTGLPKKPSARKKLPRAGVKDPSYNWPLRIAGLAACAACAMFVIQQSGGLRQKEVANIANATRAPGGQAVTIHLAQQNQTVNDTEMAKALEPKPVEMASVDHFGKKVLPALKGDSLTNQAATAGSLVMNASRLPAASPAPPASPLSDSNIYTGGTPLTRTVSKPQSENHVSKDAAGRLSLVQVQELRKRLEAERDVLKEKIVALEAPQIPQSRTNTERYTAIQENSFLTVASEPLSTFSIDVDTASYANVRRCLNQGSLPPPDAVRLEELINYFPYHYEAPAKDAEHPFSVQVDLAESPWTPEHRIARIGIKGKDIGLERVPANFVFLVDVSGSMSDDNKLPLVKRSLLMLTEQLEDNDRVALVTYAGESGVALESTVGKERAKITAAIFAMNSGGSTNGESGIELAYAEAQKHFIKEGINRVILCTDGDFNVGISSPEALEKLIKQKAEGGVFLSVLGYGQGNLQDRTMETLADKGNGNYAYIDSLSEARKVLVEQMHGTLVTIAKDVKIQVEFNPSVVRAYRLLGYDNRVLAAQDFNNDRKDAGEIGAGHTVTALYEIVTVDAPMPNDRPLVDDLKYQPKDKKKLPAMVARAPLEKLEGINDELMTVKLRYKAPDGDLSKLIEVPVKDAKTKTKMQDTPKDFQFAAAVTGFGLLLRDSEHKGSLTWEQVRKLAIAGKGEDPLGYRGEFIQLIDKANGLGGQP